MNENRDTYQASGERALQKLLDIRAFQLLMAGMYFLLGVSLSKSQWAERREQAFRMRKAISKAALDIETLKENRLVLDEFTNDYGPSWRARMKALSCVSGICKANIQDPPERVLQITGKSRGAARRLKTGNMVRIRASWFDRDQSLICLAPP